MISINNKLIEIIITLKIFTLYSWYFSLYTVSDKKGNFNMLCDLIKVMTLDIYKAIEKAS